MAYRTRLKYELLMGTHLFLGTSGPHRPAIFDPPSNTPLDFIDEGTVASKPVAPQSLPNKLILQRLKALLQESSIFVCRTSAGGRHQTGK
jgi:hypothetical protein